MAKVKIDKKQLIDESGEYREPADDQPESEAEGEHTIPKNLPLLPLREVVIFPYMALPLNIGNKKSIQLIDDIMEGNSMFLAVMIKNPVEDPKEEDLYRVGTVVTVVKMLRMPDDSIQAIVQGLSRATVENVTQTDPYMRADITLLEEQQAGEDDVEIKAVTHSLRQSFQRFVELNKNMPQEFAVMVLNLNDPNRLADILSTIGHITSAERQEVLETVDLHKRLDLINHLVLKSLEIIEIGNRIQDQVKDELGKTQRDYILREQLKSIQKELGEKDERTIEIEEFTEKIAKANMPEEAKKAAERELDRLTKMPPSAAEYTVSRTYLEWLTEMPWAVSSEDNLDIKNVKTVLDTDHSGLDKVKDRILEFLAVRKLKPDMKSPILCFVGPPGVGKTSLGMSIAHAMNRKFHRMSLGGVHDEAEIRGHRRTYIGALPGRIIQAIRRAGTNNPVIMLDEVDKIGMDFRGDPSSALLEVLDPEQNFSFQDHYLDVGFDLSKVLFIVTANVLHTIPDALRDRTEVLELPGYAEDEKLDIAKKFLIPRQITAHGLPDKHVRFQENALRHVILDYTVEAGVRSLDREIAHICRICAKEYTMGKKKQVTIVPSSLEKYLGKPKHQFDTAERVSVPGVAIGMAWTGAGGDILFIEASSMPGKGQLTLTGKLGDVMKESAMAALTYVRANAKKLGIADSVFQKNDIHIHIPAGAIPKDGPSAGVTMFTAITSLLTRKLVRPDMSMTGEISLRGQVLPVGGIKEKVMAAHRAGIRTILLPARNKDDIDEVPAQIRQDIKFHLIKTLDQIVENAFDGKHAKATAAALVKKSAAKARTAAARKKPARKPRVSARKPAKKKLAAKKRT